MTSLTSTRDSFYSSAPSVTDQDTLMTAIEKLRQKALLLQNRQRQALDDYEESEKRQQTLKTAVEEAEARNEKLIQKIDHYKNELEEQISQGLNQHRDMLSGVQQQLSELKDRNSVLESNRQQIISTSIKTENQNELELASIEEESDLAKQQISQFQSQLKDKTDVFERLETSLQERHSQNEELLLSIENTILNKLAVTDEDYGKYVRQTLKMKQFNTVNSSQENELITDTILQKFDYQDDYQREMTRPKVEETIQVDSKPRNLLASVSIFDENDNETEFKEFVAEDSEITRKRGDEAYVVQNNELLEQQSPDNTNSKCRTKRRFKESVEDSTLSLHHSRVQKAVSDLYGQNYSPSQREYSVRSQKTLPKTLKTRSRDDILLSLKAKVQDLTEEKGRLLRRLEAVQKSYMKGRDKDLRMGQIRGEITQIMRDIKMLRDRADRIRRK